LTTTLSGGGGGGRAGICGKYDAASLQIILNKIQRTTNSSS